MPDSVYSIVFAPRIEQQLNLVPKAIRRLILERIENLKNCPRPENVEPLQGTDKGLYRIRQGDYRIVYSIQDQRLLVLIVRVVYRKEVYKKKHSK